MSERPEQPPLDAYRARRDFARTPEPPPAAAPAPGARRFVVQRHDARALHFDLRLEVDGVLASWAVPKGPPLREDTRRLAMRTEDHPLEYLTFAGVTPPGQYGAGRMSVWDSGTYEASLQSDTEWKLVLSGGVLRGHYHMVRTGRGPREEWLLFRSRQGPPGPPDPAAVLGPLPPMTAQPAAEAWDDPAWAAELRWDGARARCLVDGDGTRLLGAAAPDPGDLRRGVLAVEAVLDGVVCALDARGRASRPALDAGRAPRTFVAVDLLWCDGEPLLGLPWQERRARLAGLVVPGRAPVMVSDHVVGRGRGLLAAARAAGAGGVVLKRLDAPYVPGPSSHWREVPAREEADLVVAGWVPGPGPGGEVAGLLLARPGPDGLRLVARAMAWPGHAERAAAAALLDGLAADAPPTPPPHPAGVRWVRPDLVARVRHDPAGPDGWLRDAVLAGLPRRPGPAPGAGPPPLLDPAAAEVEVVLGDRRLRLTALDREAWPGVRRRDVVEHYARMAAAMLPHLAGRAAQGEGPDGRVHRASAGREPAWLARHDGRPVVDDLAALLWLVQSGATGVRVPPHRVASPGRADWAAVGVTAPRGAPVARAAEAAVLVRDDLASRGLRCLARTAGSAALVLVVPLGAGATHDLAARLVRGVIARAAAARPDLLGPGRGRAHLEAAAGGPGQGLPAAPYALRPAPGGPCVALPLAWEEVDDALDPAGLTMAAAAARVARLGDLHAGALEPQALDALSAAAAG